MKDRSRFNLGVNADESDRAYHNVSCIVVKIGKPRKFGMIEFEVIKSAEQLDGDLNFVWMPSGEPDVIGIYGMTKEEYETAAASQNERNGLLNMIHKSRS